MSSHTVTGLACALTLLLAASGSPGARSSDLRDPGADPEWQLARFFAPAAARLEDSRPRGQSRNLGERALLAATGDTPERRGQAALAPTDHNASWDKRSALRAALHAGRRRRDPPPAPGKAVTPYISVGTGVLSDMSLFFDTLRENLHALASMSPDERAAYLSDGPADSIPTEHSTPSGLAAAWTGGGTDWATPGLGGEALRPSGSSALLHALRPLHRSYRFRSLLEPEPPEYSNANSHNPGLLWTGLGRR